VDHGITHEITLLILQLAVIILAARIFGEIFERYFKQPSVLGELVAGIVLSPYLLGAHLWFPGFGQIFPPMLNGSIEANAHVPVSLSLYSLAQLASVLLLFVAGLETNMTNFLRFAGKASIVGATGIVIPFYLGALATVWFGYAESWLDGAALFMGSIMAATSVGITARVLNDIRKLDTPEGATILGAAVVDDVLGILVLAIVLNVVQSGNLQTSAILEVALKAIGIWIGLSAILIIAAPYLAKVWSWFSTPGSGLVLTLAVCLFTAVICETVGLALIIGAYVVGLAFSNTSIASKMTSEAQGIYHVFVPVFFVVLGMLVNFGIMKNAILFGLVISIFAILGKIIGCGLAALGCGFNGRGAARVGIGMIPRGEVALIVAGYGLTRGIVNQDMFGVAIMMTLVTTLLAPIFLVRAFQMKGVGLRAIS